MNKMFILNEQKHKLPVFEARKPKANEQQVLGTLGFKSFIGKFNLIIKMYLTTIVPTSHSTSSDFFSNSSKFSLIFFNYILKE